MVLKTYRYFKFPFYTLICSGGWNILKAREKSAQNTGSSVWKHWRNPGFHVCLNMYVWKHRLRSKRQLSSSNMQQVILSELAARCLRSGLYNAINNLNMLKKSMDFVPLDWESFSPRSLRAHLPHTSSMLWGRCHNRSMCGRRREASPQLIEHSIPFLVPDPSVSLYARLPQCLAEASKRLSEESGGTRTSSSMWRCVCFSCRLKEVSFSSSPFFQWATKDLFGLLTIPLHIHPLVTNMTRDQL